MTVTVTAFYKFVTIADPAALRAALLDLGARLALKGSILIAPEGINATVSGADESIKELLATLKRDERFSDLESKQSHAAVHPFQRFKIKLKKEIITFGVPEADPAAHVGTYVAPQDWNALIADESVTVIDTRNAYEVAIGTFKNAIDPATGHFSEFPAFVRENLDPKRHKKVAMFCTGGIRCEKATAHLLAQGFERVYHLQGGILKYLETVPAEESLWQGSCFVFDERVALDHGLAISNYKMCETCGFPLKDNAAHICLQCGEKK